MWRSEGFAKEHGVPDFDTHNALRAGSHRGILFSHTLRIAPLVFWQCWTEGILRIPAYQGSDSRFAVIALWNPDSDDWFGFRTRAQIRGAAAAVLRYSCFSRQVGTLLLRVLRLPIVGYLGDFGFFTTDATAALTLQHVTRVCGIFGIALKIAQPEVNAINTLLGLQGASTPLSQ